MKLKQPPTSQNTLTCKQPSNTSLMCSHIVGQGVLPKHIGQGVLRRHISKEPSNASLMCSHIHSKNRIVIPEALPDQACERCINLSIALTGFLAVFTHFGNSNNNRLVNMTVSFLLCSYGGTPYIQNSYICYPISEWIPAQHY